MSSSSPAGELEAVVAEPTAGSAAARSKAPLILGLVSTGIAGTVVVAAGAFILFVAAVIVLVIVLSGGGEPPPEKCMTPQISGIYPLSICSADPSGELTLTVSGSEFAQVGAVVVLQSLQNNATSYVSSSVRLEQNSTLVATFLGEIQTGSYNVSVHNDPTFHEESCSSTFSGLPLVASPQNLVFYVSPPTTYNAISVQITVFSTIFANQTSAVEIFRQDDPTNSTTALSFSAHLSSPNAINALVKAWVEPGIYSVRVRGASASSCLGVLPDSLIIENSTTVPIDHVEPSFVFTNESTAVTISGPQTLPSGMLRFLRTPLAYLSPSAQDDNSTARLPTALHAIEFLDGLTLSAVVPAHLGTGSYDLIIVNPDGAVGVLQQALQVNNAPPPFIETIFPSTLTTSNGDADIYGSNFDVSKVEWSCSATERIFSEAAIISSSERNISVQFPLDGVSSGSVCVVRVTNVDNSSYTYASVSVVEPSYNLKPMRAGPFLLDQRRSPAVIGGSVTDTSRFLYAIGGDDGTVDTAKSSVESSSIDGYGGLGNWTDQRNELPQPVSMSGTVRIGRFLYLIGGANANSSALNTVYRAMILDPLATTRLSLAMRIDHSIESNFTAGFWYYRVSAVHSQNFSSNPGGESLPGETLTVRLPSLNNVGLTIRWDSIPDAVSYRVYRTPMANMTVSDVLLLAVVADGKLFFEDFGGDTISNEEPLPMGSLGVWHEVASLNTTRRAPAVVQIPHPSNADTLSPSLFIVYVFGGTDNEDSVLSTYEYILVNITQQADPELKTNEMQELLSSEWILSAKTMPTIRTDMMATAVPRSNSPAVPTAHFNIFINNGMTSEGSHDPSFIAGVAPDPNGPPESDELATMVTTNGPGASFNFRGSCMASANGFLYAFGGMSSSGSPSSAARSAKVDQTQVNSVNSNAWSSMPVLQQSTAYCGCSKDRGMFYIVGGISNGATATDSTWFTAM